ncbi:rhomboid family intramembrane serine protease [Candidatus Sumerlaeota bacterium]|nr:rhomboid family intramembrane serine protease [Candidatus Sumerlaeota bacterium]
MPVSTASANLTPNMASVWDTESNETGPHLPPATALLAGACAVVFLFGNLRIFHTQGPYAFQRFIQAWGFVPSDPSPRSLLTCLFVHGEALHALLGIGGLYYFARRIENRLDPVGCLLIFLLGGIAAVGWQSLLSSASERAMPIIGATAGILALIAALAVIDWKAFIRPPTPLAVLAVIGVDALLQFKTWPLTANIRVATGALPLQGHAAGLVVGVAVVFLWVRLIPRLATLREKTVEEERALPASRSKRGLAERLLRMIDRDQMKRAMAMFREHPDLTLPPDPMGHLGAALLAAGEKGLAMEAFEKAAVASSGIRRIPHLLEIARLCADIPQWRHRGLECVQEILAIAPDDATAREADRLKMRMSDTSQATDKSSSLARELEALAKGETPPPRPLPVPPPPDRHRPAYIPSKEEPKPPTPTDKPVEEEDPWAPPSHLPPPRPAYIPDGEAGGPAPPTHAVILTGMQRINVERVAQVVGRVAKISMVDAAKVISEGMGLVHETADPVVASEMASQLTSNRILAAAVELAQVPTDWQDLEIVAAHVEQQTLRFTLGSGEDQTLPIPDVIAIAHAMVGRGPLEQSAQVLAVIICLNPPRRLIADSSDFVHTAPREDDSLRTFILDLALHAGHAQRDAGIHQAITLNRQTCMRFTSPGQFKRYQRWLVLCAFAPRG